MGYFMFSVETRRATDTLCAECADLFLDDPKVEAEVVNKWQVRESYYAENCESCNYNEMGAERSGRPPAGTGEQAIS